MCVKCHLQRCQMIRDPTQQRIPSYHTHSHSHTHKCQWAGILWGYFIVLKPDGENNKCYVMKMSLWSKSPKSIWMTTNCVISLLLNGLIRKWASSTTSLCLSVIWPELLLFVWTFNIKKWIWTAWLPSVENVCLLPALPGTILRGEGFPKAPPSTSCLKKHSSCCFCNWLGSGLESFYPCQCVVDVFTPFILWSYSSSEISVKHNLYDPSSLVSTVFCLFWF